MSSQYQNEHGALKQLDMFGPASPPSYLPDPAKVRAELLDVLALARAAEKMPWQPSKVLYWRTVFPQMTNWLPKVEAAQLRFEFEAELARLEAA